jgi:hypothetical protein
MYHSVNQNDEKRYDRWRPIPSLLMTIALSAALAAERSEQHPAPILSEHSPSASRQCRQVHQPRVLPSSPPAALKLMVRIFAFWYVISVLALYGFLVIGNLAR